MTVALLAQGIAAVAVACYVIALSLSAFGVLRGPRFADRVVALDLMTTLAIGLIAGMAIVTDSAALLDVALGLALIGFLATVAFARHLGIRRPEGGDAAARAGETEG